MDRKKQYLQDVPEGMTPHSCEFCQRIVIDLSRCREAHDGYRCEFTFGEVDQAASQGCPMAGRRLHCACRIFSSGAASALFPAKLEIVTRLTDGNCFLQLAWVDEKGCNFSKYDEYKDLNVFALQGTA